MVHRLIVFGCFLLAGGCGARSRDIGSGSDEGITMDADADSDPDADSRADGDADSDADSDITDSDGDTGCERAGFCSEELGCPCGLVGAISTTPLSSMDDYHTFEWHNGLGARTLESDDEVHLWFSLLPAPDTWTTVGMDMEDGATAYIVNFVDGEVNDLLPYDEGAWHRVHATFRIATQDCVIRLGNTDSDAAPFYVDDVQSIGAFRVNVTETSEPVSAAIDSVSVSILGSDGASTVLFEEDFEDEPSFELFEGTLDAKEPAPDSELPEGCS